MSCSHTLPPQLVDALTGPRCAPSDHTIRMQVKDAAPVDVFYPVPACCPCVASMIESMAVQLDAMVLAVGGAREFALNTPEIHDLPEVITAYRAASMRAVSHFESLMVAAQNQADNARKALATLRGHVGTPPADADGQPEQ